MILSRYRGSPSATVTNSYGPSTTVTDRYPPLLITVTVQNQTLTVSVFKKDIGIKR